MLPRVFDWPKVFREHEHFPKLGAWYQGLLADPVFAEVRREIWNFWVEKEKAGQFDSIREETRDDRYKWKYP